MDADGDKQVFASGTPQPPFLPWPNIDRKPRRHSCHRRSTSLGTMVG